LPKPFFWAVFVTAITLCDASCGIDATLKLLLIIMFHVEQSIGTTASAVPSGVEEIRQVCCRCGEHEARKGQRYCPQCHAASNRTYRQRRNKEVQELRTALDQFTGNNAVTRRKFEQQVGVLHVIISSQEGDSFHDFSGVVIGYFPGDNLSVLDDSGNIQSVHLSRVAPDVNKWYEPKGIQE
jgi:hypothetical protein